MAAAPSGSFEMRSIVDPKGREPFEPFLSFDPKDGSTQPLPSLIEIAESAEEEDQKERIEFLTQAIFRRVAAENAIAGVLCLFCVMPSRAELDAATPPVPFAEKVCGYYERIYFYYLTSEEQFRIRLRFFALFQACVRYHFRDGDLTYCPRVMISAPCVQALMFANRGSFWRVVRHEIKKMEHFDEYMHLTHRDLRLGRQNDADERAHALLSASVAGAEERSVIQVRARIETAICEDTGILGTSWSGVGRFCARVGWGFYQLPFVPKPCTLEERRQFYRFSIMEQHRIRLALLNQKVLRRGRPRWVFPAIHFTLANLGIMNEEALAQRSGGQYPTYAHLISDDLLFRDRQAYRKAIGFLP